jgi:predicted dehydrogenase
MIWLVGSGKLALEYSKVLNSMNLKFTIIGRGKKSAKKFTSISGLNVITGGLSNFLKQKPLSANFAIVAVNIDNLKSITIELINYGVGNILLEKPGGADAKEITTLYHYARKKKTNINIAYNRRFYSSVIEAKKLTKQDGGIQNLNFNFTEWTHLLDKTSKKRSSKVAKNWFYANSTHVVDLAFYFGGMPKKISSYISKDILWNNSPALFSGSGKTVNGALFNYNANWLSAGRWSLELLTSKGKYILCPLEKLFFQKKGSLEIREIKLNDNYDKKFKPGFYKQTRAFLSNKKDDCLLSLAKHYSMVSVYKKILNDK